MNIWNNKKLIEVLKNNEVAVIPTDTIYGLVGSAMNKEVVEKIYSIKKRDPNKPLIILVGNVDEIKTFGIDLTEIQKEKIANYTKQPTSFVLDCSNNGFEYLHRGKKSLAFRIPHIAELREFLNKAGPLVAPSANPEGLPPAQSAEEAKNYFGDKASFYLDGGQIVGSPSKIIELNLNGSETIMR